MKKFEPLNDLDRINLNELVTNLPTMKTIERVLDRMALQYEREQLTSLGPEETEVQYFRKIFNAEGKIQALKDLKIQLEVESYPEEKDNVTELQQNNPAGEQRE